MGVSVCSLVDWLVRKRFIGGARAHSKRLMLWMLLLHAVVVVVVGGGGAIVVVGV